jgi:hypothetical protein
MKTSDAIRCFSHLKIVLYIAHCFLDICALGDQMSPLLLVGKIR